jgi:putative resolvase
MPRSYSVGEFADELGVHRQTVKRWCREDEIDYTRTPGGSRRIPRRELLRLSGDARPTDSVTLYGRVSSNGQKENGDLDRQIERLRDYAHDHGWTVENTYTDVGSGLNEDRRGLDSLLDDVQDAEYGRILVTYEDRLTRFGFSYLERYFDCYGVTVTVIEDETDKSAQEELVDDLIKLVASFSGKLYGMRSSKKQQVVNTVESEVKPDE